MHSMLQETKHLGTFSCPNFGICLNIFGQSAKNECRNVSYTQLPWPLPQVWVLRNEEFLYCGLLCSIFSLQWVFRSDQMEDLLMLAVKALRTGEPPITSKLDSQHFEVPLCMLIEA